MTQSLPVAALGRILAAQATFGFGWCLYLVQPKYLTVELGAGPEQVGLSSSVSAAASVAAIAAVVRVIDEPGGRRRLFQLGAVLLALASLGFQLVTDFGPLVLLLSAAIAVSYVLTFNSAMSLVTEVSPPGRLAQAFGLQTASNLVMNAISTSLAEALAVRFGWRSVFTVGASAALVALGVARRLPGGAPGGGATGERARAPYREALPVFVTSALLGAAFVAMFSFHQPFALSRGATRVGAFFVGFTAGAVSMRLGLGGLGDRFGHRRVVLAALGLYAVAPLGMVFLKPAYLWAYGAVLGVAHGVVYPTLTAFVTGRIPRNAQGRIIVVFSGAFSAGSGVGAIAWGSVAARAGYPPVFALATVAVLFSIGCFALAPRPGGDHPPAQPTGGT